MTVNVSKPVVNVREKLAELDKPTGIAGEAMLRAETPQEQFNLIGAGRRNLIINGDMRIAQRGTTFDKDSYTGSKTFTLDRFFMQGVSPAANITVSQSTDAPSGFHFSLKVTQDSAASSYPATSSQHYRIRQAIEGYDCAIAENTSCVLSFWVKSSITGQFDVALFAPDNTNNHMVVPYTIDAANTWEKKELRFIGPPNIDCNNTTGLDIQFQLARAGSSYQTNATNVWGSTKLSSSDSTDAFIKTAGATWLLTGVQLELGKVATPFEHRSYGEELALCQRYYYQVGKESGDYMSNVCFARSGYLNLVYGTVGFPTEMRTTPTVGYGGNLQGVTFSGGYSTQTTTGPVTGDNTGKRTGGIRVDFPSNWTAGDEVFIVDNDGTGFISFDAEL